MRVDRRSYGALTKGNPKGPQHGLIEPEKKRPRRGPSMRLDLAGSAGTSGQVDPILMPQNGLGTPPKLRVVPFFHKPQENHLKRAPTKTGHTLICFFSVQPL